MQAFLRDPIRRDDEYLELLSKIDRLYHKLVIIMDYSANNRSRHPDGSRDLFSLVEVLQDPGLRRDDGWVWRDDEGLELLSNIDQLCPKLGIIMDYSANNVLVIPTKVGIL